jgi:glycosyltransferase involved in cell wall biosynthesis
VKILYIFPEEFTGRFAREYHVFRLADSLAAAGCEVTLAAATSPRLRTQDQLHELFGGNLSPQLKVVWLKRGISVGPLKIRSGARFYRQLDQLVGSLKPDMAFTMHIKAADHVSRKHPLLPLVFEAHEIFADSYSEISARHRELLEIENRIYTHAWGIVAISRYLADSLRKRFPIRVPLTVQHDGIDESMLLKPSSNPDPHELIYAGSLQPWKGVPVAIEAMRHLPNFHLSVLGGAGDSLKHIRKSAPPNVTFHGHLSREEMRPHLEKASIGLMPNLLEPRSALYTFPLKLLEYSAAGKGIVASQIPVFDKLNVADWVELVPSGSPEALANGVRALALRGISRTAAQTWAHQFLWNNQGTAMKKFLESLLVQP